MLLCCMSGRGRNCIYIQGLGIGTVVGRYWDTIIIHLIIFLQHRGWGCMGFQNGNEDMFIMSCSAFFEEKRREEGERCRTKYPLDNEAPFGYSVGYNEICSELTLCI
jgi:hypothetical protein